ncbi:hypothetical protein EIP86_000100 [Pleurotus ostreatoroseus]|nr:hypothetical protein EIP86_000100 [Pleurotus ostreatoroseus]
MKYSHVFDDTTYTGHLWTKFGASIVIFCVSLLGQWSWSYSNIEEKSNSRGTLIAVSFPALSKRVKYLRIPSLVFFLGKHFGTGVILSTAFVHLLTDAFKALNSDWTGLIVLVSLLSIFLVEYISTAYVDYLHSYSSAPPTPAASATPSLSRADSFSSSRTPPLPSDARSQYESGKQQPPVREHLEGLETTSLINSPSSQTKAYGTHNTLHIENEGDAVVTFPQHACQGADGGNQQIALHVTSGRTGTEGQDAHRCEAEIIPVPATEVRGDDDIFGGGHHRHETRQSHASHSGRSKKIAAVVLLKDDEDHDGQAPQAPNEARRADSHHLYQHHHHHRHHGGHAHGHTHMDIESWGTEAGSGEEDELLAHDHHGHAHDHHVGHEEEMLIGRRRQIVGILMLQIGIMLHSLVIGLTLAITTGPEFTTLVTAILFHQLFEGLSLGIRIAALPTDSDSLPSSSKHIHLLKPTLAISFALTTPLGIGIGLLAFTAGGRRAIDRGTLLPMQGVMSAMSAGMLIYAACVEMLAGDFVMDPLMWRSSWRRQVMALASLAAGVSAMAVVG